MSTVPHHPPPTGEDASPPDPSSDDAFIYRAVVHEGEGPHETLAARARKALYWRYDPLFGEKAHFDILLPDDAPGEYLALPHLLERRDRIEPSFGGRAWIELTITLAASEPLHRGWERVRAFARRYFCLEQGLAVLMVLRSPYVGAGMASILLLVPARRLGINGFTGIVPALFSEAEPARCRDRWLR